MILNKWVPMMIISLTYMRTKIRTGGLCKMNNVESSKDPVNPRSSRACVSQWKQALGACLRPYTALCSHNLFPVSQFTSSMLVRVESDKVLTASSLFCCPFGLFHMLLPVMLAFINKIILIATETKKYNDYDICQLCSKKKP